MYIDNHISSPVGGATLSGIGWVHPNKNHNIHKINLSDITHRYLFKIYFFTDLFTTKISNM